MDITVTKSAHGRKIVKGSMAFNLPELASGAPGLDGAGKQVQAQIEVSGRMIRHAKKKGKPAYKAMHTDEIKEKMRSGEHDHVEIDRRLGAKQGEDSLEITGEGPLYDMTIKSIEGAGERKLEKGLDTAAKAILQGAKKSHYSGPNPSL